MHLKHLSLANFRNFVRLELDLPPTVTLLQGDNAEGKTNLLEAIALLSTARSPRTTADREWLSWHADREPVPYARLEGVLEQEGEETRLEMVLVPTGNASANGPTFRKQILVNGLACRALDLVGTLKVVLFMPEDVDLVAGSPSARRRFLDIALCQVDRRYCRTLSRYLKVVERRNALLRQLRESGGDAGQLEFWDRELVQSGSYLIARRWAVLARLDLHAGEVHGQVAGPEARLRLGYLSEVPLTGEGQPKVKRRSGPTSPAAALGDAAAVAQEQVADAFWQRLKGLRDQERGAGLTLVGPHRDDFQFLLAGKNLRAYGSRGQQRTAALALRLAEVEVMKEETGQTPVLLLDDVMSELDRTRREYLLRVLDGAAQAIVTTTDWDDFAPAFRARVHRLKVEAGEVRQVAA